MAGPSMVLVTGPLASYAQRFADELISVGYTSRTTRDHLYVFAQLSR